MLQVLGLLWNLAHSEDVPTEIMDQALTAHIKILDYSCSQVVGSFLKFIFVIEQFFSYTRKEWYIRCSIANTCNILINTQHFRSDLYM